MSELYLEKNEAEGLKKLLESAFKMASMANKSTVKAAVETKQPVYGWAKGTGYGFDSGDHTNEMDMTTIKAKHTKHREELVQKLEAVVAVMDKATTQKNEFAVSELLKESTLTTCWRLRQ